MPNEQSLSWRPSEHRFVTSLIKIQHLPSVQDLTTPYYLRNSKPRKSVLPNQILQTPAQGSVSSARDRRPPKRQTERTAQEPPPAAPTHNHPPPRESIARQTVTQPEKPPVQATPAIQEHTATTKESTEKDPQPSKHKSKHRQPQRSLVDINHELALLQSGLLQWCYANAKVEDTFKSQMESAERQLYAANRHVMALQDEVLEKQIKLDEDKRIRSAEGLVECQYALLDAEFEKEMGQMMQNYTTLAKALGTSTSRLPMSGVISVPKGKNAPSLEAQLLKQLEESEALLRCFFLENQSGQEEHLTPTENAERQAIKQKMEEGSACAHDLALLAEAIAAETQELATSQELLAEALMLENYERSLQFQLLQSQEERHVN